MPLSERLARETGWREAGLFDRYAEFFVKFADQRGLRAFSRIDLAARKLPKAGHRSAFRALLHQYSAILIDQCDRDHEKRRRTARGAQAGLVDHKRFLNPKKRTLLLSALIQIRKPAMRQQFKRLIVDTRGATVIEYGLICSLIVLAMMAALISVADAPTNNWTNVASKVIGKND